LPSIEERDALRMRLLRELYDVTMRGGRLFAYDSWCTEESLDRDEVELASEWLVDRGLARAPVMGPMLQLTPAGQDRVEDEMRGPPGPAAGETSTDLTVGSDQRGSSSNASAAVSWGVAAWRPSS